MITKEVNEWIRKIEKGNYSSWEIMEDFVNMSKHMTAKEMEQVKKRLEQHLNK